MGRLSPFSQILLVLLLANGVCSLLPDINVNESRYVIESAQVFPPLSIIVVGSSNERCREDSRTLMENLRNSTTWAMQMLDASSKSAEGQFIGSFYQFGNFYECVDTITPIRAQYCLVTLTIEPPPSLKFNDSAEVFYNPLGSVWNKIWHIDDRVRVPRNMIHQALCVPASCPHTDVQASISRHLGESSNHTISVDVYPSFCQTSKSEETLSTGVIVYCSIMATILLLVAVSTIFDRNNYFIQDEEKSNNLEHKRSNGYATIFSLKRSLYQLLKPSSGDFKCVNGIKFISTCLIIVGHRTFVQLAGPTLNYESFEKVKLSFTFGFLMQVESLVDSFFVMSGMLGTYMLLRTSEKRSVNPFIMILLRYLRFTPIYAVIIFFYVTVMVHIGQGPLWTAIIEREQQFCQENWWTNLLYVNNYVNDEQMCMIHSWYMAPEFQLSAINTFLVHFIRSCPTLGYLILSLTTVASLISPFATTLIKHIDPLQFFNNDEFKLERSQPYFQHMYTKSHVHATPYLVGIIAGLVLYRKRSHQNKYSYLSTAGLLAGCMLCIGSLLPGCFMTSHVWKYNDIEAAMEQTQRRFFWPLGVVVILFSLIFSKNSMIDKLLSCHATTVMSRLCYTAYLASLCMQMILTAQALTPSPFLWQHIVSRPNVGRSVSRDSQPRLRSALSHTTLFYFT